MSESGEVSTSPAVVRLKRKASDEPADGLFLALKKSKCESSKDSNEVYFKFAATLKSEDEPVKDHVQAALSKERDVKFSTWRDPKSQNISSRNPQDIRSRFKRDHKAANEKKKFDLLSSRRLIFTEELPIHEDASQNDELQRLFKLYDIIEESEDPKKVSENGSQITCNGEVMIREKVDDYVYDVYISEGQVDNSLVENTLSIRPCKITEDDLDFGGSDSEEIFEDDDDSNDENNWRNDYPDEESSSNKDSDEADIYGEDMQEALSHFNVDDDEDEDSQHREPFSYSKYIQHLEGDCDYLDDDDLDDESS